jgi:hypothetical protein
MIDWVCNTCIYESEQRHPRCAIVWVGLPMTFLYEYKISQLNSDCMAVTRMPPSRNLALYQAIIKHSYTNYFNYFSSLKL